MLVGTLFLLKNTTSFLATSITSQGTVIDMETRRSSSSSGSGSSSKKSKTYAPVIRFTDKSGNSYSFTSSTSSNPPSYSIGESIEVLYNPVSPSDAKIKGFFSIWGGILILGILGIVFFGIGISFFIGKNR